MVYCFIYGLFVLCGIPFRTKSDSDQYLDKQSTDWIRGIAILIIMIHHGVQHYDGFQFLYPFQTLGYGAVAIFLLLSGYGLGMQYQRKNNYLDGFLVHKVLRLYITFWCSYILFFAAGFLYGTPIPWMEVIPNLLTMTITGTLTWYIKVQAALYILFWLVFKQKWAVNRKLMVLFSGCAAYAVVGSCLRLQQCWWFTVMWFPVGVLLSYQKNTAEKWLGKYRVPCIALATTIMMSVVVLRFFKGNMGYPLLMDIAIAVPFVAVIFSIVHWIRFLSRPVQYIGTISLELYLVHSMLLTGYMGEYSVDSVRAYIIYLGVSIGLAIAVKHLSGGISKLIFRKK